MHDGRIHVFENGFGVGQWTITKDRLVFAGIGVVDRVPTEATLAFKTSFFDRTSSGKDENILWGSVEISSPTHLRWGFALLSFWRVSAPVESLLTVWWMRLAV